jgi:poly-gamma-glutamate synthesis protein (capsule biosynthesis protein)
VPPLIITWADKDHVADFRRDIAALRPQVDIVVASCHWGLGRDPLAYMREIAHAAIEAGADLVIGHGPHELLPIEIYRGRPICYGLGNLSFHTGHRGRKHENWIGMLVELVFEQGKIATCNLRFVRHNDANETIFCRLEDETEVLADLTGRSQKLGATLTQEGDRVRVLVT